ncbi:hypothetical protein Ancab_017825 [Ancistrocladus abbreviatus]
MKRVDCVKTQSKRTACPQREIRKLVPPLIPRGLPKRSLSLLHLKKKGRGIEPRMTTALAATTILSCNLRFQANSLSIHSIRRFNGVNVSSIDKQHKNLGNSLTLSYSHNIASGVCPLLLNKSAIASPSPQSHSSYSCLTVVCSKGYKMKTHKASAKRFRVTGRGKIMRRRAGKQHLLAKKNSKRKLRLSKMVQVNRSDYDNVIGALPYLKVNRQAK